jgi:hypothetical protein
MMSMRTVLRWLPVAAVALLFCAPLFVGLGLNDQENDEAIYSYAAQSLVETGDWLNPRLAPSTDAVFLEKPPLKFWIVALPIRLGLLPDNDFGLRFWDAVMGGLAFLYIFAIGRRMAGPFCGLAAVLILYSFDSLIFTHGLRGNNMEAPLVLAYAGAVYHFLRWADASHRGTSARHAFVVGLYFLLGFMTKFVASFFLPVILAGAALELAPVRQKAAREWRAWGAAALVVAALAAPWFLYQTWRPDSGLWAIMLGEHVYHRFHGWLDPTHLRPWSYYFTDLFEQMRAAGTWWLVIPGGLLIHGRVIRERWIEGTVALYWFWLPFVLMSVGTSKLRHYSYPFLAPVALAGGYFVASAAALIADTVAGHPPGGVLRVGRTVGADKVVERVRKAVANLAASETSRRRRIVRVLRVLAVVAAVCALALAALALVYPRRLRVGSLVLARDPTVWRPSLLALALGVAAGRARWTVRIAVFLVVLTLLPIGAYRTTVARLNEAMHPLQDARACIQSVQASERAAGRRVAGVDAYLPASFYQHRYFFYFRPLGWHWRTALSDAELLQMLDAPEYQRPVLLPRDRFAAVREAYDAAGTTRPLVQLGDVVLLLPGPYARCGM